MPVVFNPDIAELEKGRVIDFSLEPRTLGRLCRPRNICHELHADELSLVRGAVLRRRYEFSTGRYLAKQVLKDFGIETTRIAAHERMPLWPAGCYGSISHSRSLVGVLVSDNPASRSLGLDVESECSVEVELAHQILTVNELLKLGDRLNTEHLTRAFSAKEAVYKAIYPIVGQMFGFLEVELDWESDFGFTATYVGNHAANNLVNTGEGCFLFVQGQILSVFSIPA